MAFKKILCPMDFSDGSTRALTAAIQIAKNAHAQLVIAHAFFIPPSAFATEVVLPADALHEMLETATVQLDAAKDRATAAGVHASTTLLQNTPWVGIVDLITRQDFDLCVVGTHGRSGLSRVLLGSVTEQLVRHAPCCVLVVRSDHDAARPTHVLVPTDFSPAAESALERATEMVGPTGAITLLHVIETPAGYPSSGLFGDYTGQLEKTAFEALQATACRAREHSSIVVNTSAKQGTPSAEILAALEADPTIDMVIMGTHGRTGLVRLVLGSVAETVVRHARTAVLVARPAMRA